MLCALSSTGLACAALYLAVAVYVVQDELRHTHGGWINLRGMGTTLVTAPSQITVGWVLRGLGVPKVDFDRPGVRGSLELGVHVLVTAGLVYLLGAGVEALVRRIV
jgi:hypothetical protein